MRELALFAGAGGGILGGKLLGWRTVCAVELDAYCREVLFNRQREGFIERFPIWDDVNTFDGRQWRGHVDVVSGGFPCQDISIGGVGKGITGPKSGLWTQMARIIGEVRPSFVLVENSPMLRVRGLEQVLWDLACLGFDARWGTISAHAAGANHLRERMWIVANTSGSRLQGSTQVRNIACSKDNLHATEELLETQRQLAVSTSGSSGIADDVANRMDRLKAIGNGQVPGVVELAWKTLGPG